MCLTVEGDTLPPLLTLLCTLCQYFSLAGDLPVSHCAPSVTEDCTSWFCPLYSWSWGDLDDFTPTEWSSQHHGLDLPNADHCVLHWTSIMTTSLTLSHNKSSNLKPQFQAIPLPSHHPLLPHLIVSFHGFDLNKTLEVSHHPSFL